MQRNMMHYRNVLLSPMKNCIKQWRIEKYDYRHTQPASECIPEIPVLNTA